MPKQDPNSWLQWPLPHLETWLGGSNSLRRRWREKGGLNHFSYFGLGPGVYNWLAHIYLEVHMVLYGTWGRPVQFDTRTHFIWSGEGLLGVKDPRSAHFQLRGEKDVSIYQYIYTVHTHFLVYVLVNYVSCELQALGLYMVIYTLIIYYCISFGPEHIWKSSLCISGLGVSGRRSTAESRCRRAWRARKGLT